MESRLRRYLEMVSALYPTAENPARLLLERGREFPHGPSSFTGRRGRRGMCYMNAYRRAVADRSLTYAEGYVVIHGVPLEHAWLVDAGGRVVDPTITSKGVGGYYGIKVDLETLVKVAMASRVYGVLGYKSFKYLPRPTDEAAARCESGVGGERSSPREEKGGEGCLHCS